MTVQEIQTIIDELEAAQAADRPTETTPEIGVVMGSDSDLDTMFGAFEALSELGFAECSDPADPPAERFSYETYVVSAHRTPELMYSYGKTASDRGLDVIIAGAGGKSADLPNMMASLAYPIPVIGVPVQEKSVDSVIGMPTGAPITAVDAGKSFNAALSAVQILAREHEELEQALIDYHTELQRDVGAVSATLHEQGPTAFAERRQ
ncbi:5-(carboxyamino)imidazole ribonucleotide mutase [Halocatena halophila]|uniref:5-(carboxyamino)imidazole ribonucleotide mutase n=1 Tax=Halocatena halophila TaxID=2814576 RepID=UPI002ED36D6F